MQTDERKNGGKGTCFEETVPAVRKRGWDLLIWGSVVLFTLLYLSLIFNNNVWTDEIFSVNLFRENFGQIIMDTAEDVHPPLYYFLGRIFRLLFGDSLQVQKILTIIPMSLTLVLGATKIRRFFGNGGFLSFPDFSWLYSLLHGVCGTNPHVLLGAAVCDGLRSCCLGNIQGRQMVFLDHAQCFCGCGRLSALFFLCFRDYY